MLSREVPGSSPGMFKKFLRPRLDRLTSVKIIENNLICSQKFRNLVNCPMIFFVFSYLIYSSFAIKVKICSLLISRVFSYRILRVETITVNKNLWTIFINVRLNFIILNNDGRNFGVGWVIYELL